MATEREREREREKSRTTTKTTTTTGHNHGLITCCCLTAQFSIPLVINHDADTPWTLGIYKRTPSLKESLHSITSHPNIFHSFCFVSFRVTASVPRLEICLPPSQKTCSIPVRRLQPSRVFRFAYNHRLQATADPDKVVVETVHRSFPPFA